MRFSFSRLVGTVGMLAAFLLFFRSLHSAASRAVIPKRFRVNYRGYQQPLNGLSSGAYNDRGDGDGGGGGSGDTQSKEWTVPTALAQASNPTTSWSTTQTLRSAQLPSTSTTSTPAVPAWFVKVWSAAEFPPEPSPERQPESTQPEPPPQSPPQSPQEQQAVAPHLRFSQQPAQPSSAAAAATPNAPTAGYTKAVVMGKLSHDDTDWVARELADWQSAIYVVDLPANTTTSPTGFKTHINRAKEALPYLTYIIDHYPRFPDVVAFIHAHRKGYPQAWHTDAIDHDAVRMLSMLQLDVVAARGYVNLRCIAEPGCPNEIVLFRERAREGKRAEQAFAGVYAEFFNASLEDVRAHVPVVATPCCAQFAVSRAQILRRSREDYVRFREYVEAAPYDDETIGTVMEYMWHMIFGRAAVHCDKTRQCWCQVFNRCPRARPRPKKVGDLARVPGKWFW